jgi:hypothetical protein
MKIAFAILLLVLSSAAAASAQYVGYEYKGVTPETVLPNGVKHLGGALISDVDADPTYGISQVSKGKTEMLWLEVSTGQTETSIEGWRVLDVVSFPALTRSQHILMHSDPAVECTRGGKAVEDLVAIGTIDRRRGTFTPQRAWIADTTKKKFVPSATAGLRCIYSEP